MSTKNFDFLIIAPTPFYANRGCHMRIRGEAEALQRKGRTLAIVTYPNGEDVEGLEIIRSPYQFGDFGKGVSATWRNIPAGFILFWVVLRETIYKRPKVLYGHLFEGAAIGLVAKYFAIFFSLFTYFPILVLDAQDSLSEKMVCYGMIKRKSLLFTFFRIVEKFILLFPDYILTSSVQSTNAIKSISPLTNPITIPDGISIFNSGFSEEYVENFKKPDGKQKALSIISSSLLASQYTLIDDWIKNKLPIVVYGGSYSKGKGFPKFINECLPDLLKDQNVRFVFGGGKVTEIPILEKFLNKFPKRIVCLSELNSKNLLHFLLLGDIGIDCKPPHTTESSGKILNYIAAGLPVVCFTQKNNKYFLDKGGLYAANFSEFTEMILSLSKNSEIRKNIESINLKRAWSKFTWDRSAEMILENISKKKS